MTTTHRIGTGVALALALAASAAPASARPFDLNANGSEVPAGSASMPAASEPTGVPPPAARQTQAQPAVDLRSPDARDAANPAVRAIQGKGAQSRDAANPAVRTINAQGVRVAHELAARDSLTTSPPPPLIITVPRPSGFDWGDAGIGAAGGLALTMIALGGTLTVSRHRGRRTRHTTTALTN